MTDQRGAGERIRVIVSAPYASTRAGLAALLAADDGIEIVLQAPLEGDIEALTERAGARLIVADAPEPDVPRLIRAAASAGAGIVLVGDAPDRAEELLDSGVHGWALIYRDADGAELAAAARAAASGLAVMDRATAGLALARNAVATAEPDDMADESPLTPRERDVLQLMAHGLANKVIAARLGITLHTVKFHVASILSKLGAESRTEAVTTGARRGMVAL